MMSKNKSFIACIVAACITFFALPINAFAEASTSGFSLGGVTYQYGSYTYDQLPPAFQGILAMVNKDFNEQAYPVPGVWIETPSTGSTGSTGGAGLSKAQNVINWGNFLASATFLVTQAVSAVNGWLVSIAEDAFGGFDDVTKATAEAAIDTINNANYSETGSPYWPTQDYINDYSIRSLNLKNKLGLLDNGIEAFSNLKARFGFKSVNKIENNNFNFNIQTVSTGGNSTYCTVGYLIKENDVYYLTSSSTPYSDCGFCLNPRGDGISSVSYTSTLSSDGVLQLYHIVNGAQYPLGMSINTNTMATPYLYMFVFDDGYQKRNNLTLAIRNGSKIAISADQINDVPGINFDTKSDVELGAIGLGSLLGIETGRVMSDFQVSVDDEGNKYFEQISTGIKYSVDEMKKILKETTTGNQAIISSLEQLIQTLKNQEVNYVGISSLLGSIEGTLTDISNRDALRDDIYTELANSIDDWKQQISSVNDEVGKLTVGVGTVNSSLTALQELLNTISAEVVNPDFQDFQKKVAELSLNLPTLNFPLYEQCKLLLTTLFNYNDVVSPPCFDFYMDVDNNGQSEVYKFLDLSMLDYELTNKNMVDKSIWATPVKVITVIRLILCAVIYSLFITRLLKRITSFYSSTPYFFSSGLW